MSVRCQSAARMTGSGMLTDRDIVVGCIADGKDPSQVRAGEGLAEGKPVTIGADDSVEEALRTMAQYKVRRLPVIDGHRLGGIVSQGDVAKNLPEDRVGEPRRGDLVRSVTTTLLRGGYRCAYSNAALVSFLEGPPNFGGDTSTR